MKIILLKKVYSHNKPIKRKPKNKIKSEITILLIQKKNLLVYTKISEIKIFSMADSPALDDFISKKVENASPLEISREDIGSLTCTIDYSKVYFLNVNEYIVTYQAK